MLRQIGAGVVVAALVVASPAGARGWRSISKAPYGEFSVDPQSATWVGRVVTYQTLYQLANPRGKLDHTISKATIDCKLRRRKGKYATEYNRDGKKHGGSIDGGWRPIYPGSVSNKIRRLLCGGE